MKKFASATAKHSRAQLCTSSIAKARATPLSSVHRATSRDGCSLPLDTKGNEQDGRQLPSRIGHVDQRLPRHASSTRRNILHAAVSMVLIKWLDSPEAANAQSGVDTVFVAGATGNTGRRVVQQLRAKGYRVIAGVRDQKKAQQLGMAADKGITVVTADVTAGKQAMIEAIGNAQVVISAIGSGGLFGSPTKVDEQGAINLINAAKELGVQKFVMVSSLLTNAVASGQSSNPSYLFLNAFGQVLDHKLAAEKHLKASGLNYTIVRPGGLTNKTPEEVGNLISKPEDTLFGLDTDPSSLISRDTVAAVLVAAIEQPSADNKVVEVVASQTVPVLPPDQWFP